MSYSAGGDAQEFFNDDGQMWAGGKRDLQSCLSEYYDVDSIWIQGGWYDEESGETLMDVLLYFDGSATHLITDGVPMYGHGPSGAACVEKDDLPSKEDVRAVVQEADQDE